MNSALDTSSFSNSPMKILGIDESVIESYFVAFNQEDFEQVSHLFAVQGSLNPPFAKEVKGKEEILNYLNAEAMGMQALPKSGVEQESTDATQSYQVIGLVKTSFFTVNVSWTFQLNAAKEIETLTVRLLADLPELLGLRRS
ncbi:MAG TPA: ketosteroid isomerase family protein [Stenomitos sp.]